MANAETITNETKSATVSPEAAVWQIAVSEYEQAKAKADAAGDAHTAAERAVTDDVGDRDIRAEYGDAAFYNTREKILNELRYRPATVAAEAAGEGRPLSEEAINSLYTDIPRIADDILAHRAKIAAAHERHNTAALEKAWESAHDAQWTAFARLFATPAPDTAAMSYKLDILAAEMADACAEDAERVAQIRDDATRLFGGR